MKIRTSHRKGFTLIELLTAVAITTVIIGVLIGVTRMSMDAWQESRDKTRASRLAKESIEVMSRDLEGIVIRSGNDSEWLYAKMDSNLSGGLLGPDSNAEIKNPLEFVFLTAATDRYDGKIGTEDDNGGDISTVLYKLVYKDQFGSASGAKEFPVYSLYRKLVNPDETFENYLAQTDIQSAASNEDITESSNFIAENVYNLTVTLIFEFANSATGAIEQQRVPIMTSNKDFQEIRIKGNEILGAGGEPAEIKDSAGNNVSASARLAGAELGILVLSDSGMKILNNKSFTDEEDFNEFVKEHSHYFTKSVVLPRP